MKRHWSAQVQEYLKSKNKPEPRVFPVSSVSEFIKLTTWLYSSNKVIFRGQAKEKDWPLVPSAGRDTVRSCILPPLEQTMLEEFKRESIPYIDLVPQTNWQWLAIAQHNRLPTRLLDWTKNPLAALWFAVKDPVIDKQPGVVWAFNYDETEAVVDSENRGEPFDIKQTCVYFPEHVFPFIQAQSGVFTIHQRDETGSFPPLEHIKDSDLRLTKIEIPPKFFPTIRYHLFRVGISPASMWPGLSGIADKIRYEHILGKDDWEALQMDGIEREGVDAS